VFQLFRTRSSRLLQLSSSDHLPLLASAGTSFSG
jgi:hypothetical protein